MNIFNSLGSNYNFKFALEALFSINDPNNVSKLETFLENKYQGKVSLVYKGREAIKIGLDSLKLSAESYVAINGFTCFAVYEAIKKAGLSVEYLDIEKGDLNFSPETLEKALKKNQKIKAVIIQNTLGYPCDIEKIAKICEEKKIILMEDLAHSIGTKYASGREAGTVGDMVVLSFSQDKMIDGVSGGALIIKNKAVNSNFHLEGVNIKQQSIDRLYPFFSYLIRITYPFLLGKILHFLLKNLNLLSAPVEGGDGKIHKLPTWYCKLVSSQFNNLQENLDHRKKIASIYISQINPKIISSKVAKDVELSSNLRFPIFVENRESLIQHLKNIGIFVSDIWYDGPISPKRYLSQTDYLGQCPNAELASDEILNLPTHINVTQKDAEQISHLINQWLTSK